MKNRLAAAAATMTCVLTIPQVAETPAQAAAVGEYSAAPSVTVSSDDLDLTSAVGADRLERRIKAAAAAVCLKDAEKPLGMKARSRHCYRETVSNGLRQMDRIIAMRGDRSTQRMAQLATGAASPVSN